MSFVRQFTLINAVGEEYDVTTKDVLLTEPSGLGMKRENNYRRVGNRFFLLSKRRSQTQFQGMLVFTPPDAYIKYNEFMAFCTKEPLKLKYKPIDNYDYYLARGTFPKWDYEFYQDVMIESIEKGELTKYGSLEPKISLSALTPWYRDLTIRSITADASSGVVWEVSSTWPWQWEASSGRSISFDSDCHLPSPCRLKIPGPSINPKWIHYVNGAEFASGSVECVIPAYHYLVIDNISESPVIHIVNGSGDIVQDVYENADFTKKRFLEIQNGRNSIIATFDDPETGVMIIETTLFYESV